MKYTLINKFTGKLDNNFCSIYDDQNKPINEYVLQYVAITQEMADLVDHKVVDTLLDHIATQYNLETDTWQIVTKQLAKPNITQNRQRDLNNLKLEAAKYVQITDLPAAFKLQVDNYITQLNSLVIPTDTSDRNSTQQAAMVWPVRPW
jgi:hypothetical protein